VAVHVIDRPVISVQLYGRNYYQLEQFVSKRMLEKMALPNLKEELPRLHANNAQMLPEEAETEYLKVGKRRDNTHKYSIQYCLHAFAHTLSKFTELK
jgi:hypothetical protein